ncbi:MAG: glutamine--fructose-6-phosphate transaminase (isomerizing) [Patescibacteria group bacterium]|nr:glutamine--fructose-6-phosphate transaminase (isomerizing) [Patescibacteria group bacterium]
MCGIFAYFGPKDNAGELVLEGLKKLEYRGYDSWGIVCKNEDGETIIEKHVGKISDANELRPELTEKPSHIAIGHSRWATHGGVTEANAHPHTTENMDVTIVHNGILENYLELRKELQEKGHKFTSETDTEVFAHLIEENIDKGLEEAFKLALEKAEGRYALLAITKDENKIVAARRGSPLIVGINKENKEYFIASDIPAFLKHTNNVMYLDDEQMVVLNDGVKFFDLKTDQPIEKRIVEIEWDEQSAEKGNFEYFMLKEITEQKETLARAINQDDDLIREVAQAINGAFGTYIIGCGTAGKVGMVGTYLFSHIAKKHINFMFGSEFGSFLPFMTDKSLMIAISQSGETADTLEAIEEAKKKGVKIVSIVNVESSTMARISDIVIPIKAGPEKAVASTKATTSQIAILELLAYACAGKLDEGKKLLVETASQINDMLNPRYEQYIRKLAEKIKDVESMYIIGKDLNYPMALEAAIKLQEVSYIHAEGFAGGELKHGPIALISEGTPCIALIANDHTKQETLSNAIEVKARGGYIIGVSPQNNENFDFWIKVPDAGMASPIISIIPIQILAYQLAILRENNPDMPRNLAKSVTVK